MLLVERTLKELRTAKINLEMRIAQGQVEDYATYKFLAGEVKGLNNAIDILKETWRNYDSEESSEIR